ncbi:MAG: aminodeoxychorismate synthase component I [Flavobacteriia bacterium]|nr:aminodeoxychorismate synthase component I [Flavobacteriia bacterium]
MSIQSQLNLWGSQGVPFVFLIDFENKKPRAWTLEDCPDSFKYDFQGLRNFEYRPGPKSALETTATPPDLSDYTQKFNETKQVLQRGDSFLMNLTTKGILKTNKPLEDLFYEAQSAYKLFLKDEFVCFSPETFIQIKGGKINTFPMKGTIDASLYKAKELLLNNPKEQAEHATIVDLLRNDLSLVSKNVRLLEYMQYQEVRAHEKRTGQLSSWIQGDLAANYRQHMGDIIYAMLPAGSISGAPKAKTVTHISRIEQEDRGYYTGIAGIFDGNELDSTVLIRFLEKDGTYRCGGGMTHQSELSSEYEELIQKMYVPIF